MSSLPTVPQPLAPLAPQAPAAADAQALARLAARIGRDHVERRLALEAAHEQRLRRLLPGFFHVESRWSVHAVIRHGLRLAGLYRRARRNARRLVCREHEVRLPGLPKALDGLRLLQISDPHVDHGPDFPAQLIEGVRRIGFDVCVLTGDYRTRTFGAHGPTLAAMAQLRPWLGERVYAVLGNHDTIRLVPGLEAMGIRVLINEAVALEGGDLYLAGIDDAHCYRLHDATRAAAAVPPGAPSVLLSHTPEAYREAAAAGFGLMLCGHTHGGQICLPGGIPLIIDADCPRRYARGPWRYRDLAGYTSVGSGSSIVDVRLNCPPEITLHRLRAP
jgi:predicted MPP superfamily phosphohydrolase